MADITQSFNQLLLTYGPGAMLDLPNHAVVVAGLHGWRYGGDWTPVSEDRLVPLLRAQLGDKLSANFSGLRQPPAYNEEQRGEHAPGIEVTLFPTSFVVDEDRRPDEDGAARGAESRRRLVALNDLKFSKGQLKFSGDGQKRDANPIRFVAACTSGHLQDVEWRYLVHRSGDAACRKPMFWVENGVSSDPGDIAVRCSCGASISLADLYKPKFLGACKCMSPWLKPPRVDGEACTKELRLLPRSATNTYFPQIVKIISLTRDATEIARAVQAHQATIDGLKAAPNIIDVLRMLPQTRDAFAAFSDAEVKAAIDAKDQAGGHDADPRIAEFDTLASGATTIGSADPASFLFAETLDRACIPQEWRDLLDGIVKVHRLREVTCLYGFTRLEPPPTFAESEMDEIALSVDGADLARDVEWLPALEQFGEGVFLHFAKAPLEAWASRSDVKDYAQMLRSGEALDAARFDRPASHFGIAYWLLHSLSHALMAEVALQCGYPLSSLKERIYASPQSGRYGLLIYTSTAGGQGTLGGLSGAAEQIGSMLSKALAGLELCSNDPICSEHVPGMANDDRLTHGAACHACLLVPETSCEARNSRLDRSLLVETLLRRGISFRESLDAESKIGEAG